VKTATNVGMTLAACVSSNWSNVAGSDIFCLLCGLYRPMKQHVAGNKQHVAGQNMLPWCKRGLMTACPADVSEAILTYRSR